MLATLAVTLLLLLVTWLWLPSIVAYMLERELQLAGFTDISLDIRHIDREHAQLAGLRVAYPAAQPAVQVQAVDIELDYTIGSLIAGQVQRLSCRQLAIRLETAASPDNQPLALPVLPHDWASRLPIHSLQLQHLHVELAGILAEGKQLHLDGKLEKAAGGDLRTELLITAAPRDPLSTRITLAESGELMAELLDDNTTPAALSLRIKQFAIDNNRVEATYSLSGDLARIHETLQGWVAVYPVELQQGSLSLHGGIGFDASAGTLDMTADSLLQQTTRQVSGTITLVAEPRQLSLRIAPGMAVALQDQAIGGLSIPQFGLRLLDDTACQATSDLANWHCDPFNAEIDLPHIQATDLTLHNAPGRIVFSQLESGAAGWQLRADINLPSPAVDIPGNQLRLDRLQLGLAANPQRVDIDGNVTAAAGKASLRIKAGHSLVTQRGKADITLNPVVFTPAGNIPGQLLRRWPYPLHIETGQLSAQSTLNWRTPTGKPARIDQAGTLQLQGLAGQFRGFPFEGLSATLHVEGVEALQVQTVDEARLALFNPGVPFTDSRLHASLLTRKGREAELDISRFRSALLGGSVSVDNSRLDFNRPRNPLLLQVEGIDIAALIALEQKPALSGTGRLNGNLPVTLGSDGLHMTAGRLYALPPGGLIQYSGDERVAEMAKGNPGIDLLLKALRDFHYRLLEADLDYTPDGLLLAKLRLEGNNPELQGGKPVHLNINLEENILTLLRSLQLADEISNRIGENIERGGKRP